MSRQGSPGASARPATFEEVAPLREGYRREAGCQIVRDSILGRALADPYVVMVGAEPAAYGGVWNRHFPGRMMEFHPLPGFRRQAPTLFRALLRDSGATHVEAQTNMPLMHALLEAHTRDREVENTLFADGAPTDLRLPGGRFRPRRPADEGPEGEWVIEVDGRVVGAGGALRHYNPPYADLYMEVSADARRRGVGSYLVQELRRVCHDAGWLPAARCTADNEASHRTLARGGMIVCGQLVAGPVAPQVEDLAGDD